MDGSIRLYKRLLLLFCKCKRISSLSPIRMLFWLSNPFFTLLIFRHQFLHHYFLLFLLFHFTMINKHGSVTNPTWVIFVKHSFEFNEFTESADLLNEYERMNELKKLLKHGTRQMQNIYHIWYNRPNSNKLNYKYDKSEVLLRIFD